jgi:hypothetical protein
MIIRKQVLISNILPRGARQMSFNLANLIRCIQREKRKAKEKERKECTKTRKNKINK